MLRPAIQSALKAFAPLSSVEGPARPLRKASLTLLATLGYRSDKTVELPGSKPAAFLELLRDHNPEVASDEKKALFAE